jgi:hypothetical protein
MRSVITFVWVVLASLGQAQAENVRSGNWVSVRVSPLEGEISPEDEEAKVDVQCDSKKRLVARTRLKKIRTANVTIKISPQYQFPVHHGTISSKEIEVRSDRSGQLHEVGAAHVGAPSDGSVQLAIGTFYNDQMWAFHLKLWNISISSKNTLLCP